MNMKYTSFFAGIFAVISLPVFADNNAEQFKAEVLEGLDFISVRENIDAPAPAYGALGLDVYQSSDAVQNEDIQLFIPTSMYMRAGGGINLGFATDKAKIGNAEYESSGSWTTVVGLGWNLSSFVRAEIDFQQSTFGFSDLDKAQANYENVGGMLYFDLARRYVQTGDITRRRFFVPFIGVGAAAGYYEFDGAGGADGFVIAAPQAVLGFNIKLNDLIGLDIMYQYQMMIENGFGWNTGADSVDNISNVIASFRVNF